VAVPALDIEGSGTACLRAFVGTIADRGDAALLPASLVIAGVMLGAMLRAAPTTPKGAEAEGT
jgi:hypothetical protein